MTCPCLCGHGYHADGPCETCGCPRAAPDYVAGSAADLELLPEPARSERRALLQTWTDDVAAQLRYAGPARAGRTRPGRMVECRCVYCTWTFKAARKHAKTCSGACREAVRIALAYETDADVPTPSWRHEVYSRERALATGYGTMGAVESYEADLRVRREARERKAVAAT